MGSLKFLRFKLRSGSFIFSEHFRFLSAIEGRIKAAADKKAELLQIESEAFVGVPTKRNVDFLLCKIRFFRYTEFRPIFSREPASSTR